MSENNIKGIMDTTMERLRSMVDADTIIGTPVVAGNVTLIPVSRVAFGMATGGSDFSTKSQNPCFGGGGGAGVTISPIAFIAVNGDNIKMLPVYNEPNAVERAISMTPELVDKIRDLFKRDNRD